ncbi:MAG: V-type ATP synthase subunit E [Acutalibacteraceae bacterium]
MLNQKDKLDLFADVINKTAAQQVRVIEKQIEVLGKKQLEEIEKLTEKEFSEIENYEMQKLYTKAKSEASCLSLEGKKERAAYRQSLENKVFDLVKERLSAFSETVSYTSFLEKSLDEILSFTKNEPLKLFVREKDEAVIKELLSKKGIKAQVVTDSSNSLGGIKAESTAFTVDDSLDARLQGQREWFRQVSGLRV